MPRRFRDGGETIYQFGGHFWVRCPRCARRADVAPPPGQEQPSHVRPMRLTCMSCGLASAWPPPGARQAGAALRIGGPCDWYFHQPLWLQTPCRGHTLWAYNREHLEFLERYVTAELRERLPNVNRSVASRLPRWVTRASNREDVRRAIDKLNQLASQI